MNLSELVIKIFEIQVDFKMENHKLILTNFLLKKNPSRFQGYAH